MYYECRHIFSSGAKCQSPALHQQSFCYFHHTQRQHPAPSAKRSRFAALDLPLLEDAHSIQHSLNLVLRALAARRLRPREAGLLLYGLQVAASNLRSIKDSPRSHYSVRYAHALPNGTLIGDVVLAPELGDSDRAMRRFAQDHPAPIAPGEQPLEGQSIEDNADPGEQEIAQENEQDDGFEDDDVDSEEDDPQESEDDEDDDEEDEADDEDAQDDDAGDPDEEDAETGDDHEGRTDDEEELSEEEDHEEESGHRDDGKAPTPGAAILRWIAEELTR